MKRFLPILLPLALAVLAASASAQEKPVAASARDKPVFSRDRPAAAFRTSSPWGVSAFAAYDRLERDLEKPRAAKLKADTYLLGLAFRPVGWFALYGFAGAGTAKFDHASGIDPELGFAGGAGADLSVWQIDDGDWSPWRVFIRITGRWLHRESDDGNWKTACKIEEYHLAIPVTYELSFSERARMRYQEVFTGLAVAAGPAASWIDGSLEWKDGAPAENIEPKDTAGLLLSGALIFGDTWRLGVDGFLAGDFSATAYVRYDF